MYEFIEKRKSCFSKAKDSYFATFLLNVIGNWTWSEPEMCKLFVIGKYCLKNVGATFHSVVRMRKSNFIFRGA